MRPNERVDTNNNNNNTTTTTTPSDRLVDKIADHRTNAARAGGVPISTLNSQQQPATQKVNRYTLDDVLDHVLRTNGGPSAGSAIDSNSGIGIGLRSLDQADLETLLRGFEPEEAAEGKLVLYITEKQLMQLLKQRAVIVPGMTTNGAPEPNFNQRRNNKVPFLLPPLPLLMIVIRNISSSPCCCCYL